MKLFFAGALLAGILGTGSVFLVGGAGMPRSSAGDQSAANPPAKIVVDYPLSGSVFPPEITPPTFLWHDPSDSAKRWVIDVSFADHSGGIRLDVPGELMRPG